MNPRVDFQASGYRIENVTTIACEKGKKFRLHAVNGTFGTGQDVVSGNDPVLSIVTDKEGKYVDITADNAGVSVIEFRKMTRRVVVSVYEPEAIKFVYGNPVITLK